MPTAAVRCCKCSDSDLQGVPKVGLTRGNSGAKGTRTPNPLLAKQVRYQLRHGPSVAVGHPYARRHPSTACCAMVPIRSLQTSLVSVLTALIIKKTWQSNSG